MKVYLRAWRDAPDPAEDYNCRCRAQNIILNHCQQEEINYTNAYAAFFIAEQNLNRAIARKLLLEQKLADVHKNIQKEKEDKEIARQIGAGIGFIDGGLLGAWRTGLPGAIGGAKIGLENLPKITQPIEEILDSFTSDKTMIELDIKVLKLEQDIADINQKITDVLEKEYMTKKGEFNVAQNHLRACKANK